MNRKLCVLVVEDNAAAAKALADLLVRDGLTTTKISPTLADALFRLRSPGIDAVVLDLGLPDAAGMDALRAIRSETPSVPVVVLSGTNCAGEALEEGAQDFFLKPLRAVDDLLLAVRKAVVRIRAKIYTALKTEGIAAAQASAGKAIEAAEVLMRAAEKGAGT